jgi:hypothetical protein
MLFVSVSVIFEKTLRLSAQVAQQEGGGTAVTYMCVALTIFQLIEPYETIDRSVDVERVCEGIAFFHETWSSIVSIVVAAVVLWYQVSCQSWLQFERPRAYETLMLSLFRQVTLWSLRSASSPGLSFSQALLAKWSAKYKSNGWAAHRPA